MVNLNKHTKLLLSTAREMGVCAVQMLLLRCKRAPQLLLLLCFFRSQVSVFLAMWFQYTCDLTELCASKCWFQPEQHILNIYNVFQEILGPAVLPVCNFGPAFSSFAFLTPAFSSPAFSTLAFLTVLHFPFPHIQSTHFNLLLLLLLLPHHYQSINNPYSSTITYLLLLLAVD